GGGGGIWRGVGVAVMLAVASGGGSLGGVPALRRPSAGLAAAMLPIVLTPIEQLVPAPLGVHRLETAIPIHAPAAAVWEQIVDVPVIREAEQRPALFTRMGFPRPLSATIDRRAVGGVRRAPFH